MDYHGNYKKLEDLPDSDKDKEHTTLSVYPVVDIETGFIYGNTLYQHPENMAKIRNQLRREMETPEMVIVTTILLVMVCLFGWLYISSNQKSQNLWISSDCDDDTYMIMPSNI